MHEASISEKGEQHQAVRLNSFVLRLCKCCNPDTEIIYPIYGTNFRGVAHEIIVKGRGEFADCKERLTRVDTKIGR